MARNLAGLDKGRILTVLLICCLIASSYTISGSSSPQPIDPTVYNVATTGQPVRIDPARAYDAVSGELLQNIYQTLIWWNDKKPVTFTPGIGYNLTIADYSDLDHYAPVLCTEVPTVDNGQIVVNASGSYWRFTINTNAQFQPWLDHVGNTVPARNITAADVVYSFRRQVVYDSPYSPVWMWMTPAFGIQGFWDAYDQYDNGTFVNTADEVKAGNMIENWCYAVGDDVYFNFTLPWAEGPLKQIFAQTWGGVVNPDWVKEMGGWDGLFVAGWTNNYHWKPTITRSELDTYKDPVIYDVAHGSKYASFKFDACGTGPYTFTSWDTTVKIWRVDYDPSYWAGWANAGDKAGNFSHTVIWKGVSDWQTRKMAFLQGEFDECAVPTAKIYDLLIGGDPYIPITGINMVYNIPALQNKILLFSFSVPAISPYQSYVGYPTHTTGPEQFFFNNTHIRRAFAWALDYATYVEDAWFDEAIVERTWWVEGLSPPEYKNTNASMPQRNLDYAEMQAELNQAVIGGFNVGAEGFETYLAYDMGNEPMRIACNLIAQAFQTLGSKYKCNVIRLDWPVYVDAEDKGWLPIYRVGWMGDFADPYNFCEPYQATWGAFCSGQFEPAANAQPEDQGFVDTEIHAASIEPNGSKREAMYEDLQYRYWLDVPSFPLMQPVARRWARDWVQGWYYNALYPGLYAYDLYKSTSVIEKENVDIKISVMQLTPTYNPVYVFHGQMRIGNGNPAPAKMTWNVQMIRNDDNDAVPVLYVLVSLARSTVDQKYYVSYSFISIAVSGVTDIQLTWWEDGIDQIITGSRSGIPYEITVEALPLNGIQNDTSAENTRQALGTIIAKTLVGDVNGDGIVNIFDAILLAIAFGTGSSSPRWNAYADLNGDDRVDIFDAILLTNDFQNHVP